MEQCSNCGATIGALEVPHLWLNRVVCAMCHGRLAAAPAGPAEVGRDIPGAAGIRVPLLVAGISNLVAGVLYCLTCVLSPLGAAHLWLGIQEITTFKRIRGLEIPELEGRARWYSTLEICTFLDGNLVAGVCGIIIKSNLARLVSSNRGVRGFQIDSASPKNAQADALLNIRDD